jgi:hypothetical protein
MAAPLLLWLALPPLLSLVNTLAGRRRMSIKASNMRLVLPWALAVWYLLHTVMLTDTHCVWLLKPM